MGPTVGRIDVAGKRVSIRARGRGPAVLVVHGWQGSSLDLFLAAEELVKRGFTVVSCDMPAHGETEGRMTSVAEFIETIEKVEQVFGPFHGVVAHSLGGTAATLAVARGLSTSGLVLLAPMVSFDFALDEFARMLHLDDHMREITALAAEKRVGLTRAEVDLLNQVLPEVPLMIFHDRQDPRTPYHHSEHLAAKWPSVEFVATEGLGHRRILSDVTVIRMISNFLDGLPRRPADPLQLGIVPELLDAMS
jgi:pimeloyl-ACP methyl ester carboxylesterase